MPNTALRDAVWERLDRWDQLATHASPEVLLPIARNELHRLVEGLRELLREHDPDGEGHCLACTGRLRNKPWPCDVWLTAHRQLIGDHTEHAADHSPGRVAGEGPVLGDAVPSNAPLGSAVSGRVPTGEVSFADETDVPEWPPEHADPDLFPAGTGRAGNRESANHPGIVTSWDTVSTAEIPAVSQRTPGQTAHAGTYRAHEGERPVRWREPR